MPSGPLTWSTRSVLRLYYQNMFRTKPRTVIPTLLCKNLSLIQKKLRRTENWWEFEIHTTYIKNNHIYTVYRIDTCFISSYSQEYWSASSQIGKMNHKSQSLFCGLPLSLSKPILLLRDSRSTTLQHKDNREQGTKTYSNAYQTKSQSRARNNRSWFSADRPALQAAPFVQGEPPVLHAQTHTCVIEQVWQSLLYYWKIVLGTVQSPSKQRGLIKLPRKHTNSIQSNTAQVLRAVPFRDCMANAACTEQVFPLCTDDTTCQNHKALRQHIWHIKS